MPWKETCCVDERMGFIGEWLRQEESVSELCERFGISRKTGHKWLARYRLGGAAALVERSHAPRGRVPWAISEPMSEAIVALRGRHRHWGPRKLRAVLMEHGGGQQWPAASTIGDLLRRLGLSEPRKRRRRCTPSSGPLGAPLGPNDLWPIDFKGHFRTGDGARCDPLTITDGFSRYLLCCEALARPTGAAVRVAMERVFREYGLPRAIRSDNGAPFAGSGVLGLSALAVWWLKLGIVPERIAPGKPQQNGRHERMHRTLKAETATPPGASLAAQRQRFGAFRSEYNEQRPHEALGQQPPARCYVASPRRYPARLEDPLYPAPWLARRVRSNGEIRCAGELVFISQALAGEVMAIAEADDGFYRARFAGLELGLIDPVARKLHHRSAVLN
jgi:transposase InsO family protein